jgi:hypothetical protein
MSWFKKNPAMPAELAEAVAPEGRLLDWSTHASGLLAVTKNSLIDLTEQVTTITPWSESVQAKWEPPRLTVVFQGEMEQSPTTRSWILDEASQLPRAVRDRVTATVVVDRLFELPNAGKVRFVARKDENRSYWTAIAEDQVASQTEIGQQEIAKAVVELRSAFGI